MSAAVLQLVVFVKSNLVHQLDVTAYEAAARLIGASKGSPQLPVHLHDQDAQQLIVCFIKSYSAQLAAANPAPPPVQAPARPLPIPGLSPPAPAPAPKQQMAPAPQEAPAVSSSQPRNLPVTAPPPSHRPQSASRPAYQTPKPTTRLTPAPGRASAQAPSQQHTAGSAHQAAKQQTQPPKAAQQPKAARTPGPSGDSSSTSNLAEQERILALYRERRRQELEDIEFARRLQVGSCKPCAA